MEHIKQFKQDAKEKGLNEIAKAIGINASSGRNVISGISKGGGPVGEKIRAYYSAPQKKSGEPKEQSWQAYVYARGLEAIVEEAKKEYEAN